MKKISWPWIGSTEYEMGSDSPKGELTDKEEGTQEPHDTLVPQKHLTESNPPATDYDHGMVSPVDGASYAKDGQEMLVDILDQDHILCSFTCNVASDLQSKIDGLQTYSHLQETAGLIFPYKVAEDVVYHMGKVSFPIDIIFVDSNNLIKKIYKNIQPGTLATFGCAQVSNVLEICGGLSDRLGIKVGNILTINLLKSKVTSLNKKANLIGSSKNVIFQYSTVLRSGFHRWNNYPVLVLNHKLNKQAHNKLLISEFVSKTKKDRFNYYIFDFDDFTSKESSIKVYQTLSNSEDNPRTDIYGKTVFLDKKFSYREIPLAKFSSALLKPKESILQSNLTSLNNFLNPKDNPDLISVFQKFKDLSVQDFNRVIIATRHPDPTLFRTLVCAKVSSYAGIDLKAEALALPDDADIHDLAKAAKENFGNHEYQVFADSKILKRAGNPIPDQIKSQAKKAYRFLEAAKDTIEESVKNLKINLSEYEKIKNKPEAIAQTKGQYNQSIKSNTLVVKKYLLKIRDAIHIFDNIRDISTTAEIIDSLASSAKLSSKSVENIFELINQVDSPDFYLQLKQETLEYERVSQDLKSSVERGMEYINSNILGLVILSN